MGILLVIVFRLLAVADPFDLNGQVRDIDLHDRIIVIKTTTGFLHYQLTEQVKVYDHLHRNFIPIWTIKEGDLVNVINHHGVVDRIMLMNNAGPLPTFEFKKN